MDLSFIHLSRFFTLASRTNRNRSGNCSICFCLLTIKLRSNNWWSFVNHFTRHVRVASWIDRYSNRKKKTRIGITNKTRRWGNGNKTQRTCSSHAEDNSRSHCLDSPSSTMTTSSLIATAWPPPSTKHPEKRRRHQPFPIFLFPSWTEALEQATSAAASVPRRLARGTSTAWLHASPAGSDAQPARTHQRPPARLQPPGDRALSGVAATDQGPSRDGNKRRPSASDAFRRRNVDLTTRRSSSQRGGCLFPAARRGAVSQRRRLLRRK